MDWTKAKSILIVALIITNLILIFVNVYKNDYPGLNLNNGDLNETLQLLENKNIFVEADIPHRYSRMPVLTVEYDRLNQEFIEELLAKQKELPEADLTDEKIIDLATDFIRKSGYLTDNVKFYSIERKFGKTFVTFRNYINDIPIEDSSIICTLSKGKIINFERYWLNPVELSKMKKNIIQPEAALVKLMNEKDLDERIVVKDISLVYWLDSQSFDPQSTVSDTAFPTWKITSDDGQVHYIIAFEQ